MGNSVSGLRRNLETWGRSIQLSADGAPKAVTAGVTVNWTTITAVAGSDIILEDAVQVKVGQKYIRYGSILIRMADGRYGLAGGTGVPAIGAALPGEVVAVNETVLEEDRNSNHPPCIDAGRVFRDRLLSSSNGATGMPTLAEIRTAIPGFTYAFN